MKILPNGQVEIRNGDTGEVRVISPAELSNYGIEPADYEKAVKVTTLGAPVKTYGASTNSVNTYNAPALGSQSTAGSAPLVTPTPKKVVTRDEAQVALLKQGYAPKDVEAALNKKYGAPQTSTTSSKAPAKDPQTLLGFAGNVVKSGVSNAVGIAKGIGNVFNNDPEQNTLVNLARLPFEAGMSAAGDKSEKNRFNALVSFYKERYGTLEKAKTAFYEDPVGVALDASVVLGGAGAVVKGAGTLGKIDTLTRAGTALSDASRVIDPLAQSTKVLNKGLGKISDAKAGMAESTAARSTKATPTALEDFEDISKNPLGKEMVDRGIYTAKDVQVQKKVIQGLYDSSVKTGQKISGKVYADNIRAHAAEIEKADRSIAARKLVADLRKEADVQQKLGDITDSVLAKTKTGEFSKAGGAVSDPSAVNLQKELGIVGIKTLEGVAPGSSKLGKELQKLTEMEDIIKKGKFKGQTTNRFNVLKPYGAGASIGGALGFGLGGPAGAVVGAGIGGAAAGLIDSPAGQRVISKTLAGAKVPEVVKKVPGDKVYGLGKISSRVTPGSNSLMSRATDTAPTSLDQTGAGTEGATYDGSLPQNPQDVKMGGSTTLTGKTMEYWNNQYQQAMRQSPPDEVTAKFANDQYEKELAFQTKSSKLKEKSTGQKIIDNSLVSIEEMKTLYGVGTKDSLSLGDKTVGLEGGLAYAGRSGQKLTDQKYVDKLNAYKNVTSFAAGILNQARGAGVLNAGEYEVVLANVPNEWTSETNAKSWFTNLERIVKRMDPVLIQSVGTTEGLGSIDSAL